MSILSQVLTCSLRSMGRLSAYRLGQKEGIRRSRGGGTIRGRQKRGWKDGRLGSIGGGGPPARQSVLLSTSLLSHFLMKFLRNSPPPRTNLFSKTKNHFIQDFFVNVLQKPALWLKLVHKDQSCESRGNSQLLGWRKFFTRLPRTELGANKVVLGIWSLVGMGELHQRTHRWGRSV